MKRKIPDETRKLLYERDNGICQESGCELSSKNGDRLNIHHIRPEQFGGTEDPNNLITLCDIHHKLMHTEFHAFYPDSRTVLVKMNYLTRATLSKIYKIFRLDDGFDLSPYLEYLTGSKDFRYGQLDTVRAALKGQDVLFVTPTGSGKSVCYQLPGLMSTNPSLVISPLKSLMKDQVESIWRRKIPATYINSDLSEVEKQARYRYIRERLYKFLFVAPERFFSTKNGTSSVLYQEYGYLVVDEAHEIDMWGRAFRPSYKKIGELRRILKNPPVIALTASASKETQDIIINSLGLASPKVIVTGFERPNIHIKRHDVEFSTYSKRPVTKLLYVQNIINENPGQKIIIFVPTIKAGDSLQDELSKLRHVDFYHGKIDSKTKMDIQDRFNGKAHPEQDIIIATSAFGMGIDIPNIRHVIHWSPALNIEDYYQQIGRAGRDGKQSCAHLLHAPDDVGLLEFMATVGTKSSSFKQDHGYTDTDVALVREKQLEGVTDMLKLIEVEEGQEWTYILNYFGQTPKSYWQRNGMKIIDQAIKAVIIICLVLLAIGLIGKVF